ncbi:DnaJ family domain-containing protein [Jeotgalibacillus aurantiacus]|uniref:DnaJ family domain-containing protein n=1 Tax=Jeotgalibacillus aurantiacus TaxID=2763266 RepID=UPI001D0BA171|nr:DnaJ family domain-containing protein [Jeotgalibacillus aurantiacus]
MKNDDHVHWMDQAFKDFEKENNLSDNPGFGKPLSKDLFKGDTYAQFEKTARAAGYLPEWVKIRKQIASEIEITDDFTKKKIDQLNAKVKKYNKCCPPPLQKPLFHIDLVDKQLHNWL